MKNPRELYYVRIKLDKDKLRTLFANSTHTIQPRTYLSKVEGYAFTANLAVNNKVLALFAVFQHRHIPICATIRCRIVGNRKKVVSPNCTSGFEFPVEIQ